MGLLPYGGRALSFLQDLILSQLGLRRAPRSIAIYLVESDAEDWGNDEEGRADQEQIIAILKK